MAIRTKKISRRDSIDVTQMFESCIGCKWTLHVLAEIRRGNNRPGTLVRSAPGLTTKVLNERLAKLVRFGVIERVSFPVVPPHVEYHFTDFGRRFLKIIDQIEQLRADVQSGTE